MGVESELPIPMPEIPPPGEQDGRSQPPRRRVMASSNPPQWQWGMYNNVARHNAFQAAQSQQAYAAWQQYYQNLYQTRYYPMQSSYQAAPQVNAMYSDMYQRPIASPNQAWQHTYPTSYTANPAPSTSQLDQQNSWQKKSNPPNNTYCNASNGWEWLQPQVPQDAFALFGETLLCPIKVFVYVLQELFRNEK